MQGHHITIDLNEFFLEKSEPGALPRNRVYECMSRYGLYGFVRSNNILGGRYDDSFDNVYMLLDTEHVTPDLTGMFGTMLSDKAINISVSEFYGFLEFVLHKKLGDASFKIDWRKAGF